MNESLFAAVIGSVLLIVSGAMGFILTKVFAMDGRMIRLETTFELWGHKAAGVLHSPHTPVLDALLEKYVSRTYELSNDEWRELNRMCEQIEKDISAPKEERALAAIVSATCHHKLLLPLPKVSLHN